MCLKPTNLNKTLIRQQGETTKELPSFKKEQTPELDTNNLENRMSKPIPIFLPNEREALLYLPRPFYKKDIEIANAQISAFLQAISTDDE